MASTTSTLPRFAPLTAFSGSRPARRPNKAVAISARDVISLARHKKAVLVDLSDWESIDETGWIEGSLHCPPGEFASLIDPASPLHVRLFAPGVTFIFYGGPEAAPLAAAKRARALGLRGAMALRGGLKAWRNAGGRVAGHPESPFPALRASFNFALNYALSRVRAWWTHSKRRPERTI